ncbi:MAG: hypothetical protein HYW07_10245 [Candidatus Latescibacteria bacterium]|nr:hypothetical protein [Candidatus Latescibacterota bacterium]
MAEETAATTDRLELRLDRLEQGQLALRQEVGELKAEVRQVKDGQGSLRESMARLVGVVEQLSQRVGNLEQNQRWVLGILITSWLTLMLTILLKG